MAHARFWDPPLEVVRIPFEGSEIIGYMRLPKNVNHPVPIVIAGNGLDSRKEDLAESFGAILPYGFGFIAVDGPGTGQSPIKASPTAERMLSRVIDYLQTRLRSLPRDHFLQSKFRALCIVTRYLRVLRDGAQRARAAHPIRGRCQRAPGVPALHPHDTSICCAR